MQQVADGHWVIQCRACGKRRSKHHFDRALDCHEYWRDHVKTKEHLGNIDPNHFDERDAAQFATEELLRKIFGVSS